MMRTLVIGDVHGNYDRLRALLVQEGVVDSETEKRINHDVEVVQLGDLGDFGDNPTGDLLCYQKAADWLDVLLWGNHDRANISQLHAFRGQRPMTPIMKRQFSSVSRTMKIAHEAHGFLLTHAGLHPHFQRSASGNSRLDGETAKELADELNFIDTAVGDKHPALSAISVYRGGRHPYGGVLWRHVGEKLASVPQIFGHSSRPKVRAYFAKGGIKSYCIDVGSKHNGRLCGMWLPEQKVVEVTVRRDVPYGVGWPE